MEDRSKRIVIAEVMEAKNEGELDGKSKSKWKDYLISLHKKEEWSRDAHFKEILAEDSVTQEDIDEELQEQKHKKGYKWQHWLEKYLTYTPFQIFCLILAIIDVAVVIAVILIQLNLYKEKFQNAEKIYTKTIDFINNKFNIHETDIDKIIKLTYNMTYAPQTTSNISGHHKRSVNKELAFYSELRRQRRGGGGGESIIPDSEYVVQMHHTVHNLHITSVSILAFFTVLVFLKIAAEGLPFFKKVMEILDSLIVIVSFLLDVLILAMVINPERADAAIVILLLWQIVRIFNGIMMMEIQRLEMRVKLLKRGKKKLKEKIDSITEEKHNKDKEIESLQNLSKRKGATDDEVGLCKPAKAPSRLNAHSGLGAIASLSLGFSMQAPVELDKKALKGKMKIQRQSDDFANIIKEAGFSLGPKIGDSNDADNGKNSDVSVIKSDIIETINDDVTRHAGNDATREVGINDSGGNDVTRDAGINDVGGNDVTRHADGGGRLKHMDTLDLEEYNVTPSPGANPVTINLSDINGEGDEAKYNWLSNSGYEKLKFGTNEYDNLAYTNL